MIQRFEFAKTDVVILGQQFDVRFDAMFVDDGLKATSVVRQYGFDSSYVPVPGPPQFSRLWVDLHELRLSLAFFD